MVDIVVDMEIDYKNIWIKVFYIEDHMVEVDTVVRIVKNKVVEDKAVEDKVVEDKVMEDTVEDKRMITSLYLIAILYFD